MVIARLISLDRDLAAHEPLKHLAQRGKNRRKLRFVGLTGGSGFGASGFGGVDNILIGGGKITVADVVADGAVKEEHILHNHADVRA